MTDASRPRFWPSASTMYQRRSTVPGLALTGCSQAGWDLTDHDGAARRAPRATTAESRKMHRPPQAADRPRWTSEARRLQTVHRITGGRWSAAPIPVAAGVMDTRSVSRCVAIAAHGKRCQQSPFRGSPYCWHHTQSRKIWAPSRPLVRQRGRERAARAAEAAAEAAPKVDRETPSRVASGRGARRREAGRVGAFLEGPDDGAYLLVKDDGGLLSEHSMLRPPRPHPPHRVAPLRRAARPRGPPRGPRPSRRRRYVGAEREDLEPAGAGLDPVRHAGADAHDVARADLHDLVIELQDARAGEDHVDLLGLPVAVGEGLALARLHHDVAQTGLRRRPRSRRGKRASWNSPKPCLAAWSSTSREVHQGPAHTPVLPGAPAA